MAKKSKQAELKKDFVAAYDNTLGNVSTACKNIGICRKTFYNWYQNDQDFADKIDEVDEAALDFSETMLKKNIREGREASIFFHLKTKGKHRGYSERQEYEHSVKHPFFQLMEEVSKDNK